VRSMIASSLSVSSFCFLDFAMDLFGHRRREPEDTWYYFRGIPPEYAHALGVFTAFYNLLERDLLRIVEAYLDADRDVREFIYFEMTNKERCDLVLLLAAKHEADEGTQDAIRHLIICFNDCVQNRNILLHATHLGTSDAIEATKRASDNSLKEVVFDVSLGRLRKAADDIRETHDFLLRIRNAITRSKDERQLKLPFDLPLPAWRDIPLRPDRLIPRQPDPAPDNDERPPRLPRRERRRARKERRKQS
jgi:hypothetical protein